MKTKAVITGTGRTRALFNTGTRVHTSNKDYTRKVKHKKRPEASQDSDRFLLNFYSL